MTIEEVIAVVIIGIIPFVLFVMFLAFVVMYIKDIVNNFRGKNKNVPDSEIVRMEKSIMASIDRLASEIRQNRENKS